MDLSEFMNIILGGGLVGTVATIGSLRATVRKAKAEAMKAEAGAEAMRIDNAEHATRILMENIVKPLKDEFCETKKELARNTREMARLRKAIDTAGNCPHRDDCPVLDRLRESPKEHEPGSPDGIGKRRQRERKPTGGTGDLPDAPLIYVGGLVSRQKIDEVLDSGFDAVQMARALLNEPGFVNRMKQEEQARCNCGHSNYCIGRMYTIEMACHQHLKEQLPSSLQKEIDKLEKK